MEEPVDFEPSFGPGSYKDNTPTVRFTNGDIPTAAETIARLADVAGLPLRMPYVDLLAKASIDAAEASFEPTLIWHLRLLRSVRSHSDRVLERRFGRIAVARMEPAVATELLKHVFAAVRFWQARSAGIHLLPPVKNRAFLAA